VKGEKEKKKKEEKKLCKNKIASWIFFSPTSIDGCCDVTEKDI